MQGGQKKYYQTEKGKEKLKLAQKKYYQTEKGKMALKKYYQKYSKTNKFKKMMSKSLIKYNSNNRARAIEILGGKCVHCGFSDSRALQIDHINGGGCKENRKIGNTTVCRIIIRNPEESKLKYQLLCANCNWIKRAENKENKQRKYEN